MFYDLDQTLAALLEREWQESFANKLHVSFAAPDREFPPPSVTLPAVDLFLYDVRENLELRESAPYVERSDDAAVLSRQPPVRVDASYLITAWPAPGARVSAPSDDEHWLLGEVMRILLRYRVLPEELLQGELANQLLPLPVSILQPGRLPGLGEFWQALGGKPKAALNYTVTLAVDVTGPQELKRVTDRVIKVRLEGEGRP